jgi:hypothetical protein
LEVVLGTEALEEAPLIEDQGMALVPLQIYGNENE